MGTDLRKLVFDGYPGSNVIGCDLRPEYVDLGYELFGDRDRCPIRFITGNIFDLSDNSTLTDVGEEAGALSLTSVNELSQLRGALTHLYTGALFHLFDEETQYKLAVRLALLVKRSPGTVIFGRHQGLKVEGMIEDNLGG